MGIHTWGSTNATISGDLTVSGSISGGAISCTSATASSFLGVGGTLPSTGGLRLANNTAIVGRTTGGTNCQLVNLDGSNVMTYGSTASTFNIVQVGAGGGIFLRVNATDQGTFDATGVAFNGGVPAARPDYTITNLTTDRAIDCDTAVVAETNDVLGSLITDLIAIRLVQ